MRQSIKYAFWLVLSIAFGSMLSYVAFHGFWFGAMLFHSVPAARACDAVGKIFLIPVRLIYAAFGGALDQSIPLADPTEYAISNGIVIGTLLYSFIRRILFRGESVQ